MYKAHYVIHGRLLLCLGNRLLNVLQITVDLMLQGEDVARVAVLCAHKREDKWQLVHLHHLVVGVHRYDCFVPAQAQFARLVAGRGKCWNKGRHQGKVQILLLTNP